MKKRFISLATVFCLFVGMFPVAARAVSTYDDNTILFNSGNGYAIKEDGSLWAWGHRAVGNGTAEPVKSPVKILDNVKAVYSEDQTTFALQQDGTLWAWGKNQHGQVGDGTTEDKTRPVRIMTDVISVSATSSHAFAIKADGSLWGWGDNSDGQLGDGTYENNRPTPIKIMEDVSSVASYHFYTNVIKKDGSLWFWGSNYYDKAHRDHFIKRFPVGSTYIAYPYKVMDNVLAVANDSNSWFVIKSDSSLWAWGSNHDGQLGDGTTENKEFSEAVKIMENVKSVQIDYCYAQCITNDDSLWEWGWTGRWVPMPDDDKYVVTEKLLSPTKVMDSVSQSAIDQFHRFALKKDGGLWAWGNNRFGILGIDNHESDLFQTTPVLVMNDVCNVQQGDQYAMCVKTDGTLWAWGNNSEGAVGNGGKGTRINFEKTYVYAPVKIMDGIRLTSIAVPSPIVGGFDDVHEGDWFAEPVLWAVKNGVTNGTGDSMFSPNDTCTTAQILTFLWRASGSPEPTISNPFNDVKPGDYYYKAALWAAEKNLIGGTSFSGGAPCTRAATVTYLWKLSGSPDASGDTFSDIPAGSEYAKAVSWAVGNGITNGTGDGQFSPGTICNRGQIVTFLYRYSTASIE